jgi:hypothetical protein
VAYIIERPLAPCTVQLRAFSLLTTMKATYANRQYGIDDGCHDASGVLGRPAVSRL